MRPGHRSWLLRGDSGAAGTVAGAAAAPATATRRPPPFWVGDRFSLGFSLLPQSAVSCTSHHESRTLRFSPVSSTLPFFLDYSTLPIASFLLVLGRFQLQQSS